MQIIQCLYFPWSFELYLETELKYIDSVECCFHLDTCNNIWENKKTIVIPFARIIYSLQSTFWYHAYPIVTREQPLLWGGGPTTPSWGELQQTSRTAPTSLLQDRLHATALFGNQTLVSIVHFHWTSRSRGYIVTEFALNSTTARTVSHAIYISTAVLSGCSAYWLFDSWKHFLCTLVLPVELVSCVLWHFRAFLGCDDLYRRVRFSAFS